MNHFFRNLFGGNSRRQFIYRITRHTQNLGSSEEAANFFRKKWDKHLLKKQEQVYAIYVNDENKVLKHVHLHTGGVCKTIVDNNLLFRHAIVCECSGLFIAHNHPNGKLTASQVDKLMTVEIIKLCTLLNIRFLDHIILTEKEYYSFAEGGLLEH